MKFTEYKENKQHGSPVFPVQYYYVDEEYSQYVMPLHWHSEFEIIRVQRGVLHLYLNNEEYVAEAGSVIFIGPGTLHRAEPLDCAYECAVFHLKLIAGHNSSRVSDLVRELLSAEAEVEPECPEAEEQAGELIDLLAEEGDYFELRVIALVAEILHILYTEGYVKPMQGANKRFVHRRAVLTLLIDKIEKDYTEKITLSELSAMTQINEKYLCRFFREFTGQTPIDYINRLRVDRACYEMTVNRLNVTEAAYESGFNELSYFSKIFKKYKGITPGQYRKRHAAAEKEE